MPRDGTDDSANGRAAAGILGCPLVGAETGFALFQNVNGTDLILAALHGNRLQIEHQV